MKRLILIIWWALPILMALFLIMSSMYMFAKNPSFIETVFDILLVVSLVFIVVSWILLLINKHFKKFTISFIMTLLIIIFIGGPAVLFSLLAPDRFGIKHPIPDGLEYNVPLADENHDSISATLLIDTLDINTHLQIWNIGFGFYKYDFYSGQLPTGEIYLRCYEVTENIPLSVDRIEEKSKVLIDSTTTFTKLVNEQEFTIYEGDWGDYYAARIEVWFKDVKTNQKSKLLEKIYRVEGCSR